MTNTELVLNMLAEVAATEISEERQPVGFDASAQVAKEGALTAKVAREQLEKSTGKSAVSSLNAKSLGQKKIDAEKSQPKLSADTPSGDETKQFIESSMHK